MNRPGQPQRPPSMTQNPGLSNQFRPPYPSYGMPPRNVNTIPGSGYVTGLQPNAHRAPSQQSQVQSMVPQSTPGFIQQRGQSSFAFGGGLAQHQSSTTLQQQQPSSHQQQTNGTSTSLPPHLTQNSNLGTAPPVSSTSDVGLDPNDFPALGSAPANNTLNGSNGSTTNSSVTTSYASQAGTGVPLGGAGGGTGLGGGPASGVTQTRDFTPDDFPALGGHSAQGQNPNSSQDNQSHPPGLNGFQHPDPSQQHRQALIGSLGSVQSGTPGVLNLGQTRTVHSGFQQGQTEAEKQQQRNNYALKLNQATHAAWGSPNANPGPQSQGVSSGLNLGLGSGTFANPPPTPSTQPQQNGNHSITTATHLNAPPGVPPPYVQQAHTSSSVTGTVPSGQPQYTSNGMSAEPQSSSNPPPSTSNPTTQQNPSSLQPTSMSHSQQHPQTPAQQVLISAADRWGLLGLLAMLKNVGTDLDQGMVGIGTDLGTMGLDMAYSGDLYSTFITPWADQSAARTVEPDFHLPTCYASVQAPPPGPNKASAFSDETLFFMFYSSPRDALQEVAAQELWNRNWRYHKDLRLWITKESGTSPSQKVPGGEQGQYTFWDPDNWAKERKEMTVLYIDLEEKNVPAFVQGPGLVLALPVGHGQAVGQQHQTQVTGGQVQQVQPTQRGSFQMGMAGL